MVLRVFAGSRSAVWRVSVGQLRRKQPQQIGQHSVLLENEIEESFYYKFCQLNLRRADELWDAVDDVEAVRAMVSCGSGRTDGSVDASPGLSIGVAWSPLN